MADKITTISKVKVGTQIGRLDDGDIVRFNAADIVFLGLAFSPRASDR
jgi:mRNA interferase MazF